MTEQKNQDYKKYVKDKSYVSAEKVAEVTGLSLKGQFIGYDVFVNSDRKTEGSTGEGAHRRYTLGLWTPKGAAVKIIFGAIKREEAQMTLIKYGKTEG